MDYRKYLNFSDPSLTFPNGASGAVVDENCAGIDAETSSDVLGNTKHDLMSDTSEVVAAVSVDTESAVYNCVPSFSSSLTFKNTLPTSKMMINHFPSTTFTPSSFSSSSAATMKKTPHCLSLKKTALSSRGYKSFEDWNSDPNHVYIGRDMSHLVEGGNGFQVGKSVQS